MRHFARRQACAAARTADTTEEGIMDTEASSDRPVDQSTVQKRGAATGLSTSGGTEHKSRRCSTVCGTKNPQARKSRRQSIISQEIELLTKLGENQAAISEGRDGLMDQYEPRGCSPGKKSHGPLMPSQASQKLAESNKLEDQINLQHLVELMRIFHVSKPFLCRQQMQSSQPCGWSLLHGITSSDCSVSHLYIHSEGLLLYLLWS